MIKEKHLVPGQVLVFRSSRAGVKAGIGGIPTTTLEDYWQPCMVVSHYPVIKQRHARKTAPVDGWEVLVVWMGDTTRLVDHVHILPGDKDWKAGW